MTTTNEWALAAEGLCAGYGSIPVLKDVDVRVRPGEIVTILGPNGAGKTTTLLALAGELRATKGSVSIGGRPAVSSLHRRARQGLAFVPDTRGVFAGLNVRDNVRLGRVSAASVFEHAPEIAARGRARAGLLSGGEQQILAVARAIARRPGVLLIDEMSLGLAPKVVTRLVTLLKQAAADGVAVVIVEQHTKVALGAADRAYVLSRGEVVHEGPTAELLARPEVLEKFYLARSS
ncbi:MAG TPA: ABC transporter ATP-binding protein [Nocardioides sp.]|nr:ABC transporter ATP-binding protein [Nocardioides sp.]